MSFFDAEVPGQTAASAEELRARSGPGQQFLIRRVAEDRRLVAVRLHERLDSGQVRQLGADAQQVLGKSLHPDGHAVRRLIGDELERIVLERGRHEGSTPMIGTSPVASRAVIVSDRFAFAASS